MDLRYVKAGDTVHFAPISGAESSLHVQALIDSIFLVIDREALRRWMSFDAEVASAVAAATASELAGTIAELTHTTLRPLRTRICNHLLYLAERWPERDGRLPLPTMIWRPPSARSVTWSPESWTSSRRAARSSFEGA